MLSYCSGCRQDKPTTDFYPAGGSRVGFQTKCKICQKIDAAERYIKNKESIIAKTTAYAKANPDIRKRIAAKYLEKNINKVRERGRMQRHLKPEIFKERDARFSSKNKDKIAAKSAKRRSTKQKATPNWANKDDLLAFYSLADVMTKLKGVQFHVDHIVPLKSAIVCGLHCPANLQILPGAVNCSKGNRYWPDMPE